MRRTDLLAVVNAAENKDKDIWLSEETLNDLFGQARYVKTERENLVLAFATGPELIIVHEGYLIGEFEAYWTIIHFDTYNRNTIIPVKHKGCIVL